MPAPRMPAEDDIDDAVRADLDRWERDDGITFVGRDGPRLFPGTHDEAQRRVAHFHPWVMVPNVIGMGRLDDLDEIAHAEAHRRSF